MIAGDVLHLAASDERAKLVARVPEQQRPEAEELLLHLAATVAAERVSERAKTKSDSASRAGVPLEPWPHFVNASTLLTEIQRAIERYVKLPSHAAPMLALWVAHTYVTDVADYTPYIHIGSPVRECGKSVTLEVLLNLAHDAQMSGGYTAAALYRRISRSPGTTMLLDELDTRLRGDGGEAIRGVLNTGFQRLGKVTICSGDEHEDKDFSTFCPKVLAGIGRVWDTVASRCIPVRMERATKDEMRQLARVRGDRIGAEFESLRQMLVRWSDDTRDLLREMDPPVPDALGARQADVWRPLFAIADDAGRHVARRRSGVGARASQKRR